MILEIYNSIKRYNLPINNTIKVFSIKYKIGISSQHTQKTNNNSQSKQNQMPPITGIWGNIRSKISELLGNDGNAIDVNWFSKLSAEINNDTKQIKLKAPSEFYKRSITDRYQNEIQLAAKDCGFSLQDIYCYSKLT